MSTEAGGIVPGPPGTKVPIMAMAGERVSRRGESGDLIYGPPHLPRMIMWAHQCSVGRMDAPGRIGNMPLMLEVNGTDVFPIMWRFTKHSDWAWLEVWANVKRADAIKTQAFLSAFWSDFPRHPQGRGLVGVVRTPSASVAVAYTGGEW